MPMMRPVVAAVTTDALANSQFNIIPAGSGGARVSVYGSAVTKTDKIGLNIGSRIIIPANTSLNIESSADVIDNDRDGILFNEYVPEGQLVMPVNAVTTELQVLILITYINPVF